MCPTKYMLAQMLNATTNFNTNPKTHWSFSPLFTQAEQNTWWMLKIQVPSSLHCARMQELSSEWKGYKKVTSNRNLLQKQTEVLESHEQMVIVLSKWRRLANFVIGPVTILSYNMPDFSRTCYLMIKFLPV